MLERTGNTTLAPAATLMPGTRIAKSTPGHHVAARILPPCGSPAR